MHDLVISNARCVATMDADRRELAGGWVAIDDGLVSGVGTGEAPPGLDTI
ncbi:MAG: 8-oxoguanine deaminase, partial [Ilumatobacter sp.]|nr:8-oxoguanine deaminase [Ilumatobacter sp.]